ncbi:PP2C family protein-serine/threonine phosphatase [Spirillospora sp. CA-294931]|uniref:PP2C family protein-serine/threonine phosphatase n=1 Tax=Spirillospora sp. CA-294931 TaxID=3240042 RepID=UPI003D907330
MTGDQGVSKATEPVCATCGEAIFAGEEFCEGCGRRLGDGPLPAPVAVPREGVTMKVRPGTGEPATLSRRCAGCGAAAIDADGYCERCGLRQPADRDHVEVELPGGVAAGVSDRGLRYSRNEDALAVAEHPSGIAAVVCDGVGSSQRPDEASAAAAEAGATELVAQLKAGTEPAAAMLGAILRAADAVAALAGSPSDAPSCTFVSAVTTPEEIAVGWVGDSRAYWLPTPPTETAPASETAPTTETPQTTATASPNGPTTAGGTAPPDATDPASDPEDTAEIVPPYERVLGEARQLTDDDSWAAFMVAEGALTEEQAEAHPNAHVITGWLGADNDEVQPNVRTFTPGVPGTLLVCSDGLWNYLPAPQALASVLQDAGADPVADPLEAARVLVKHALEAGGRDNITVAVLPVPHSDTEA